MKLQLFVLLHLRYVMFASKLALLWTLGNYSYPADPTAEYSVNGILRPALTSLQISIFITRSLIMATLAAWVSGWSLSVGAFTFLLAMLLPLVRRSLAPAWLAEMEIAVNVFFFAGAVWLAKAIAAPLSTAAGLGLSGRQVACVYLIVSMLAFVLRGGTYIVRGVLNKGRTLPGRRQGGPTDGSTVDFAEVNRGRIIGNIERLMLLAFVALQAYQALAFLITAKGLFRAKDIEQAEFAEYFLVGTLISSMVAIAAGLGIQLAVKLLW